MVSGQYLLGSANSFLTTSGSIDVTGYVADHKKHSLVRIESYSGGIRAGLEPLDGGGPVRLLTARLKTSSGSVSLRCPRWEGRIIASSRVGRINVIGPGARIIRDVRGPHGVHVVEAVKGDESSSSTTEVVTESGNIQISLE